MGLMFACPLCGLLCLAKRGLSLIHIFSGVLQKLSVVNGVDEDKLLVFLDLVLQLADFPGVSDWEVLSLIYPYCRGSLAGLVTNTLRRGSSADAFHGEVLDFFIPHRRCLLYTSGYKWQQGVVLSRV